MTKFLKLWATPDEQIENPTHHVIVDEECIATSALTVDEIVPSGSDPFIKDHVIAYFTGFNRTQDMTLSGGDRSRL